MGAQPIGFNESVPMVPATEPSHCMRGALAESLAVEKIAQSRNWEQSDMLSGYESICTPRKASLPADMSRGLK